MTETILASAVAVTVGVVGAVRLAGIIPDRFLPIISIVVGSVMAWLLGSTGGDIAVGGIIIGLMASGTWSGGKTLFLGEGRHNLP